MVPIINRYIGNGLKFCWYRGDLWSKISKKKGARSSQHCSESYQHFIQSCHYTIVHHYIKL
jgi:hypothetical protein